MNFVKLNSSLVKTNVNQQILLLYKCHLFSVHSFTAECYEQPIILQGIVCYIIMLRIVKYMTNTASYQCKNSKIVSKYRQHTEISHWDMPTKCRMDTETHFKNAVVLH